MKIILASNSPRRKELLKKYGVDFTVIPSNAKECEDETLSPEELAKMNASIKGRSICADYPEEIVLAADTVVYIDGRILGKPKTKEEAFAMLNKLSGNVHIVVTGYFIGYRGNEIIGCEKTKVAFNTLKNDIIEKYIESGACYDKAGSYGIQDGYPFVESYEGSYANIVGLPVERILELLNEVRECEG